MHIWNKTLTFGLPSTVHIYASWPCVIIHNSSFTLKNDPVWMKSCDHKGHKAENNYETEIWNDSLGSRW